MTPNIMFSSSWLLLYTVLLVSSIICSSIASATPPLTTLRQFYDKMCEVPKVTLPKSDEKYGDHWDCSVQDIRIHDVTALSLQKSLEDSPEFQEMHATMRRKHRHYFVVVKVEELISSMYLTIDLLNKTTSSHSTNNKHNSTSGSSVNSPHVLIQRHYQEMNTLIDQFVTARPWWIIRQYLTPRIPSQTINSNNAVSLQHNHIRKMPPLIAHGEFILERVPTYVEALANGVLAQSFPADCGSRVIYVKTSIGSWGNDIIVNMESFLDHAREHVHMLYLTNSGHPEDPVGHVEHRINPTCAAQIDKHTCAFLPNSNCSVPTPLRKCISNHECIQEGFYGPDKNNKGEHVYLGRNDPMKEGHKWSKYFPDVHHHATPAPILHMNGANVRAGVVPGNVILTDKRDDVGPRLQNMYIMFGIIYRMNHFLGLHVQNVLEEFFDTPVSESKAIARNHGAQPNSNSRLLRTMDKKILSDFEKRESAEGISTEELNVKGLNSNIDVVNTANSNVVTGNSDNEDEEFDNYSDTESEYQVMVRRLTEETSSSSSTHSSSFIAHNMDRSVRCHIAHIRMGDRYINRTTNMYDWCERHTNHSAKEPSQRPMGLWEDGHPLSEGQWHDMGCSANSPFGTLTLQHYVNASRMLNEKIEHLLVVTDDYHWLTEELIDYRNKGVFKDQITIHVFPTHLDNVHRSRATMQATAEWWGAITAARQCEGFIGHTRSAASFSYYRAMCFHHRDQYLQCPPWFMFE